MKPITIHGQAEAELRDAYAYYEGQREGFGDEFRGEFASAVERIRQRPDGSAPIDAQGTRKHRLRRFPYTVYYLDSDEALWVLAVAHQKRRPGYWSSRKPEIEDSP